MTLYRIVDDGSGQHHRDLQPHELLVPVEPNYEAAHATLIKWQGQGSKDMAKAIVDAALGEPS